MLALYNSLGLLTKPLAAGWAAWKRRDPQRARECDQRMARELPDPIAGSVWLHGASVGEARLVLTLAERFRTHFPERPLALSATTWTGLQRLSSEHPTRFVLPFDFRGFPTRVLERIDPHLIVILETELWPNLIHEAYAANVPIALVNARLAPERIRRYRRFERLYRPLIERLAFIGAQSEDDAERFRTLGAGEQIRVTGNLKYDLAPPRADREALAARLGGLGERPIFVAGSTRPGEEVTLLGAFKELRQEFPDLLLILAPRHLSRIEEVLGLVRDAGWEPRPWSVQGGAGGQRPDVVVIDTLGELASLYEIGTLAFVGGSLEPFGGHSPLEPAASGTPVLFGPHTEHFADVSRRLVDGGAARRVAGRTELTAAARVWLSEAALRERASRAARDVVRQHSGATQRTFDALQRILASRHA